MLPCVSSVKDHRRRQNEVRTSVTHSAIASSATFVFLAHFDVICGQYLLIGNDVMRSRKGKNFNLKLLCYMFLKQKRKLLNAENWTHLSLASRADKRHLLCFQSGIETLFSNCPRVAWTGPLGSVKCLWHIYSLVIKPYVLELSGEPKASKKLAVRSRSRGIQNHRVLGCKNRLYKPVSDSWWLILDNIHSSLSSKNIPMSREFSCLAFWASFDNLSLNNWPLWGGILTCVS